MVGLMVGNKNEGGRCVTMRQRNLRCGGGTESSRDSGNNLKFDAGVAQGFHLFAGAPEDERIAAFQADDLAVQQRVIHQQGIDLLLGNSLASATLADILNLGGCRNEL